ncbi:MAG: TRAP transporter small permease [Clostridiaceae bacterium]|jgi:TRAP-type C4-dicarboxylate transport system permease small subunit|nr:TRAP transporter small permease [Clostridiaceae bacterium]
MVLTLEKISNVLTKIMRVLMIILFVWMTIALTTQVFARYLFAKGFVWTDESARYCMIWMIFIGATEVVFNDEHIKVTVVEDFARGVGKKIFVLIQHIAGLVFSVIMAWYSFPQLQLASKAVSSNMSINMGIVFGIFPVVTILMIIGYIFRIVLLWAKKSDAGGEPA